MARAVLTYKNTKNIIADFLRQSLLTGTAIVLPVLITAFVFLLLVDLLASLLNPMVIPVKAALGTNSQLVTQVITFVILLGTILIVGAVTESSGGGDRLKQALDYTMAGLPGISSIYGPIDQMSTMLLEGDTQNFENVVLVEFPHGESYTLAFQTSHPPDMFETAVDDEDMLTVFMPMGPNPFMGGFILHLSEDEVYDVDLSVEEGITSIISFGVAVDPDEHSPGSHLDLDGPYSD
jgi:uncharacterized membrane protein